MKFYIGLGLQLVGFSMVGLCLFRGLDMGDYGKVELIQFISGTAIFYVGNTLRGKWAS